MVASIRRIDTAAIRSFVTHHTVSTPAVTRPITQVSSNTSYDMMNTAQVSTVMDSLSSASLTARKQATETYETYHARLQTQQEVAQKQQGQSETQQRLRAMNHSSVSQDISALLKWNLPTTTTTTTTNTNTNTPLSSASNSRMWVVERTHGNFEVGVRELARMGAFGRDKASSRLMELAL